MANKLILKVCKLKGLLRISVLEVLFHVLVVFLTVITETHEEGKQIETA